MKPAAKPSFCAGCAEPRAELSLRGRHWLCPSCDPGASAPQRPHRLGPERGYDAPEKHVPIGGTRDAFASAANRIAGRRRFSHTANGSQATPSRPGFVTVRVARCRADGTPMDAREARQTLSGEPWFAEVQHRGTTLRYHLFDRPDVESAREVRSAPNVDPMAVLRDAVAAAQGSGKR